MNTFPNNCDAIESLIFDENLSIEAIDFHPELDVMLIILNTKVVLHQKISSYPSLKSADINELLQYKIIARGTGIHWNLLDEDLSLKGFLSDELRNVVKPKNSIAA